MDKKDPVKNAYVKAKFLDKEANKAARDFKTGRFVKGNPGGGRPRGSRNIDRRRAAERLGELGCDPLEILAHIAMDPQTSETSKLSAVTKLMEYGYSKQPMMSEVKHDGQIPIMNVAAMPTQEDDDNDDRGLGTKH